MLRLIHASGGTCCNFAPASSLIWPRMAFSTLTSSQNIRTAHPRKLVSLWSYPLLNGMSGHTSGMRSAKPSRPHSTAKLKTTPQQHEDMSMKKQNDDAFEGPPANGTKLPPPASPAGSPANNKNPSGGGPGKGPLPNPGPGAISGGDSGTEQKSKGSADSDSDNEDDNGKNSKGNQFPSIPGIPCQMINDNDGHIQYMGVWTLESKDLPHGMTYTSHTTTTAGSQASILFNGE